MEIDTDTARRIARLANIRMTPDELSAIAGEFTRLLAFIGQLDDVDVEGVEPMGSPVAQRLKRFPDRVSEGDCQDLALANAPDAREGFFAVPKVRE